MDNIRRFKKTEGKTTKYRVWNIWTSGAAVVQEWGQEGGKMQKVSDLQEAVNVGKANERSPEQQAVLEMTRQITLKKRHGYVELDANGNLASTTASGIDWSVGPPQNFRPYKPKNSMPDKLIAASNRRAVVKRNGMGHLVVVTDDGTIAMPNIKGATQHKNETTFLLWARIEHIVAAFQRLADRGILPPRTMLAGELVRGRYGHEDDFDYVSSIMGSLTPEAMLKQKEEGALNFYLWDVLYWNGALVPTEFPIENRHEKLEMIVAQNDAGYLLPPEYVEGFSDGEEGCVELKQCARDLRIEGWVVWEKGKLTKPDVVSFTGTAYRPSICGKLKPDAEDDFIGYWDPELKKGEYGSGKNSGIIGSIALYQYEGTSLRFCGNCASGLTDAQRRDLADSRFWPRVCRIVYEKWTKDSMLRLPRFDGFREDKLPRECLYVSSAAPED